MDKYDFYYSEKQKNVLYDTSLIKNEPLRLFKGCLYTECTIEGRKLTGKWDDYIFIGTGTFDDVVIGSIMQKVRPASQKIIINDENSLT